MAKNLQKRIEKNAYMWYSVGEHYGKDRSNRMNIKQTIKKILTDACVLFSLITAAYALIVWLVYVNQEQVLMEAGRVVLFFVFSLLVSGANGIYRHKPLSAALRLTLHFLICTLAFYLCFLLPLSMPGSSVLVGLIFFVLAYFLVMGIVAGLASRFRKNREASEEYKSQYKKMR